MAQPDSKPFTLQNPTELALAFGNDKNRLLQAVYAGLQGRGAPIDPTSALLAGRLIDESKNAKPPIQSVFAKTFAPPAPPAGLGATPQGMQMAGGPGPQMAAPPQMIPPAPQGPVRMAVGGLTTLPIPDDMYDEQSFAGGGIVAFADAGDVRTKRRKALMAVMTDPDARSDQRMAARMELNAMEGMGSGRTPGPGLADALADLDAATGAPVGGTRLDPAEFNRNPSPSNLFRNAEAAQRGPQMPNLSGFGDAIMAANLRETDAARGTDASGGMSLRSPELAAIDARSRARNEAAGQVPFRGFGDALRSPVTNRGAGSAPTGADGLTADYSLEADYPRVTAGPNKGKTLSELTAAARAANEAAGQVPFRGFGDTAGRMAAILGDAEINTYGNREAAGGMSLRSPELAAIDARSRAKNEAAGQVPFRGFGDTAGRMAAILGDAEINTYGNREAAQRGPRAMGSIDNLGELTRTLAAQFSPPPSDPTGLNALIASNNPNVRPASSAVPTSKEVPSAPVRTPAPRGERGVAGVAGDAPRATRTPATSTTAAGTDTPNAMTLREIQARIDEAGKLPEFQRTSAEELAARKNEDLWSALAQIGFGAAAGDSPYALTNIGKGAAAAMPGMQASLKERRADERDERNREFDYLVKKAGIKGDNFKSAYTIFSSMEDREQRAYLEKLRIKAQETENRLNREVQTRGQDITATGQKNMAGYYNRVPDQQAYDTWYMSLTPKQRQIVDASKAARYARSTNNTEDTEERVRGLGGKGGNPPGLKYLGVEPEGG